MSTYEALALLHSTGQTDMGALHGDCRTACFTKTPPLPPLDERVRWHADALRVAVDALLQTRLSVTANLDVAGPHRIHPLLAVNRLRNDIVQFPHLCKFASHVPFDFFSPARVCVTMCLARLYPRQWASLYSAAFHAQRVPAKLEAAIDRYNAAFLPPEPRELLEILELFRSNVWPSEAERRAFIDAHRKTLDRLRPLVPAVFSADSMSDVYRLTAALLVVSSAIDERQLRRLFAYVVAAPRVLKRHCRALYATLSELEPLPDEVAAQLFAQFKIKPRIKHIGGTFGHRRPDK